MNATEILMDEHRVIERVLDALESAANLATQGGQIRPGFFIDASDFIKGFADGCHHMKEEGVLFKAMIESGMPAHDGPIAVMLAEHEQGRMHIRGMRAGAEKWLAVDLSAREAVVSSVRGYVTLLRQHIVKEDNVLFPMADRVIPLEKQDQVTKDFERIEHEETGEGVHEKYLTMAETLEKELNK